MKLSQLLEYNVLKSTITLTYARAKDYQFDARLYFSQRTLSRKKFLLSDGVICECDNDFMIGVDHFARYHTFKKNIKLQKNIQSVNMFFYLLTLLPPWVSKNQEFLRMKFTTYSCKFSYLKHKSGE